VCSLTALPRRVAGADSTPKPVGSIPTTKHRHERSSGNWRLVEFFSPFRPSARPRSGQQRGLPATSTRFKSRFVRPGRQKQRVRRHLWPPGPKAHACLPRYMADYDLDLPGAVLDEPARKPKTPHHARHMASWYMTSRGSRSNGPAPAACRRNVRRHRLQATAIPAIRNVWVVEGKPSHSTLGRDQREHDVHPVVESAP